MSATSGPAEQVADLTMIVQRDERTEDRLRKEIDRGTARSPRGPEISADRHSLLRDWHHWMPVMGEMQYSRCPRSTWRDSLLKMKAGGIDIVATYVFWIHHEEIEGQFDFSGQRSLRDFATLCQELGLYLQVRCGPWAHGECRNGGFPDWLMHKSHSAAVTTGAKESEQTSPPSNRITLRTDDPGYLAEVRRFYQQVADQLRNLLWKDGGPVIGVQIENEFSGPGEHLITLKRIARDVGLDVPIYVRTGWPGTKTKVPFGELLPLYGGYAEGFWDRNLEPMPGKYWEAFYFKPFRTDSTIATDRFGVRQEKDEQDTGLYPYLTCELGGGMATSYHRRVHIFPKDVIVPAMIKLGVGNSLPGYYVYHGGTNPDGKLSTLNESQATDYPNDIAVKSYDFQAPLGEFGQVREHYHWLRRMHLFIHDYDELIAPMESIFPAPHPQGKHDTQTLRWCVRSDGAGAFLFFNNYQRLQPMPAKENTQFRLRTRTGDISLPSQPVTIPPDSFFIWPLNIDLGGAKLVYATAEIICNFDEGDTRYVIFAQTTGIPAEFVFDRTTGEVTSRAQITQRDGHVQVRAVQPGLDVAIRIQTAKGKNVCIVLLDQATSLTCWKLPVGGRERLVLSSATLLAQSDHLRCQLTEEGASSIALFPAPAKLELAGETTKGQSDGIFVRYAIPKGDANPPKVSLEQVRPADPARVVPIGSHRVAQAPDDAEFERAAVWRIKFESSPDSLQNVILRIHYQGDVARAYLSGRLLTDNFYNGTPFDLGLDPFLPEIAQGELLLKILPLRKDAPIYLLPSDRPPGLTEKGLAQVQSLEVIQAREVQFFVA